MLKSKLLVVANMVFYVHKIIHVDFRCGMGCYNDDYQSLLIYNISTEYDR